MRPRGLLEKKLCYYLSKIFMLILTIAKIDAKFLKNLLENFRFINLEKGSF